MALVTTPSSSLKILFCGFLNPQQVKTEVTIVPKLIPNPDCPISLHFLVGPNLKIPLSMATPQGRPLFSQPAWSLKNPSMAHHAPRLKAGMMCACPWCATQTSLRHLVLWPSCSPCHPGVPCLVPVDPSYGVPYTSGPACTPTCTPSCLVPRLHACTQQTDGTD